LKPAEETAKLRKGGAGLPRVQIGVGRVKVGLRIRVVRQPVVSMWLRMGVAVGVDSRPSG